MKTPERTTAEVFPQYIGGEVIADSAALKWPGLFVRHYRFRRVVDGFLVPATAEPLIACNVAGFADFQERQIGREWLPHRVRRGDLFVTGSKTPYELRWNSPLGAELEVVHIHIAVDQFTAALQRVRQDQAAEVEVIEFFGRDETLAHLSVACAELLSAGTAGHTKCIAAFAELLAIYVAEKYTTVAAQRPDYRGGLPIAQLRKIENHVRAHLSESISIETLAELVELSPFPFFARIQAGHRDDASAIRDPRAHAASATTDPRNLSHPHRNRARSRLHKSEPFCSGLSADGRHAADTVFAAPSKGRRANRFFAEIRRGPHDPESSHMVDS